MATRRVITDTSSNNGKVDFVALRRAHPEWVGNIAKATEGSSYVNPLFDQQSNATLDAGGLLGAYGFAHPSVSGIADVDLFRRTVGTRPIRLGAAWDCEVDDKLSAGTVLARFMEDLAALDKSYPGKDFIYTGKWFWDPHTAGSVAAHVERYPLWVSYYVATFDPARALPVPWTSCKLWQFTDNYFGTGLDASVWMGTDAEWDAWVGSGPALPNPGAARFAGFPVLRAGASDRRSADPREPVTALQNALNIVHRHESKSDPARLNPDGEFGPATTLAVGRLQEDYHRAEDHVVGVDTWTLLAFLLTAMHR